MPGWTNIDNLLEDEFTQSREEGRDPAVLDALRGEFEAARGDVVRLTALHEKILATPVREDFPFVEPDDLAFIHALRRPTVSVATAPPGDLPDRLLGAWLGRCVGCALGKPVEGFMPSHNGLDSWQRQKRYLTAVSPEEWPVRDYFPAHSPAESETGPTGCPDSTRDRIAFMETDDDIRYTVLGQVVLEEKGAEFSTADVAAAWVRHLSYKQVCTAETQAYRNLTECGEFHFGKARGEADWTWVATHLNPYREWIGAQIRVDSYGYAAPGNPALAAEFAWRDARLSHVKNGLYGAMFCAAMIAAAFVTSDVRLLIEAGLGEIPASSRLHGELRQVVAICERERSYEAILAEIYALLGHYSPVHTNNNAAICVAALLAGQGDFAKSITHAVMGGWDTDCNGATVGSIVGAVTGARRAPEHWTGRLNDTLNAGIIGYHPIAISECARRSLAIARKVGTD